MTDLTRALEYLAIAEKGQVDLVKYGPRSWLVRINDLDDLHAAGVGSTLSEAAKCAVECALNRGLMHDPCPITEPHPAAKE